MIEPELAKVRPAFLTFMPVLPWALTMVFVPVAIVAFFVNGGFADGVKAGMAAVAGVTPVIVVICIVCASTYHVRVHADGVSSYDPFGSWKRDFVTWEDMREIHRVSVLGVPYCRIDGNQNGPLWIPSRSFSDPEFVSAVQKNAPNSRLVSWMVGDSKRAT